MKLLPFVNEWWNTNPFKGWLGYGFIPKLKGLKVTLKEWNQQTSGFIEWRVLSIIDVEAKENSISVVLNNRCISIKEQLLSISANEEIKCRQKCKVKWFLVGDENTTFFHEFVTAKKRNTTSQRFWMTKTIAWLVTMRLRLDLSPSTSLFLLKNKAQDSSHNRCHGILSTVINVIPLKGLSPLKKNGWRWSLWAPIKLLGLIVTLKNSLRSLGTS